MMMAHSMVYGIMYITAFDFIHLFSRNSVSLRIKKEEHFRIILRPAIIRRDVEFLHGIAESLRLLLLASRAFVRPANNLGVAVSRATPIPHFAALKGPGSCLAYYIVG
ncbi:uncharacterized protein TrAFT101_008900 [Trichoderma asperellum]|uniref:uncharacterized protein n=1 Tax=Trichoderma asperellum TaxID=101201 RepID=UPI00331A60F7|nr:hypothetical protein TrAFT101_008900 [Trichoderma asperellum]